MTRIKVLFAAANPRKTSQVALEEKVFQINDKVFQSLHRDSIELITAWADTPDDFKRLLLQHQPHVLHFSGHGAQNQELVLAGPAGRTRPVDTQFLVDLLTDLKKHNLRLAFLNACMSAPQVQAISSVVDCVIGIDVPLADKAAFAFAASFYRALGYARTLQEAFDLGCLAQRNLGVQNKGNPRLCPRAGVDPSTFVFLPGATPGHTAASQTSSMPDTKAKPMPDSKVALFVSYSRKDKKWLDDFKTHLAPLERLGKIDIWDDSRIASGSNWRDEIQNAIDASRIAVLLVTKNFLASDFIARNELPPLLDGKDRRIFWIPVGSCDYKSTEIEKYGAVIDPARPVSSYRGNDRDRIWVDIVSKLKGHIENPR